MEGGGGEVFQKLKKKEKKDETQQQQQQQKKKQLTKNISPKKHFDSWMYLHNSPYDLTNIL